MPKIQMIANRTTSRVLAWAAPLVAGALLSACAATRPSPPGRPSGPPPEPPQQVFDACKDKKDGDACTVELGHDTVSGTCERDPKDRLACRPAGPPPGAPPGPPPGPPPGS